MRYYPPEIRQCHHDDRASVPFPRSFPHERRELLESRGERDVSSDKAVTGRNNRLPVFSLLLSPSWRLDDAVDDRSGPIKKNLNEGVLRGPG